MSSGRKTTSESCKSVTNRTQFQQFCREEWAKIPAKCHEKLAEGDQKKHLTQVDCWRYTLRFPRSNVWTQKKENYGQVVPTVLRALRMARRAGGHHNTEVYQLESSSEWHVTAVATGVHGWKRATSFHSRRLHAGGIHLSSFLSPPPHVTAHVSDDTSRITVSALDGWLTPPDSLLRGHVASTITPISCTVQSVAIIQ